MTLVDTSIWIDHFRSPDRRLASLGWVDVNLLASVRLAGQRLWTRDRRLALVAHRLGVAA